MSFVSDTGSVVGTALGGTTLGATALGADTVAAPAKPQVAAADLRRVRFALGLIVVLAGLDALFYLARLL